MNENQQIVWDAVEEYVQEYGADAIFRSSDLDVPWYQSAKSVGQHLSMIGRSWGLVVRGDDGGWGLTPAGKDKVAEANPGDFVPPSPVIGQSDPPLLYTIYGMIVAGANEGEDEWAIATRIFNFIDSVMR